MLQKNGTDCAYFRRQNKSIFRERAQSSPIETDIIRGMPKDKIEQLIDSMAVRRLGTFTDVANVLDFFLRRESEAVTGQVIYLGGVPNG